MKHILLLIAVAFAAHAFELDLKKNVYKTAWWSANKQLDRCSLTVQKDKRTGVQALCAQWDGSVTNYMHAMLIDGKDMPVFKRAKFMVVVSVNMPLAVNAVKSRTSSTRVVFQEAVRKRKRHRRKTKQAR